MVLTGRFEMFLEVLIQLPSLAPETMLRGCNILLVRGIRFLVMVVVAAGGNCDLLGLPLLPIFAIYGAFLSSFAGGLGWCPQATTRVHCHSALDKDNPDCLFTRSMSGGNIKKLLCGLRLIMAEFMHQGPTGCAEPEC
jgi:hypothetical protein